MYVCVSPLVSSYSPITTHPAPLPPHLQSMLGPNCPCHAFSPPTHPHTLHSHPRSIPKAYGSYSELVSDSSLDAIYVATPNGLHGEWAAAALDAGKHVLCEKPFTANAEEARWVALTCWLMSSSTHSLASSSAPLLAAASRAVPRAVGWQDGGNDVSCHKHIQQCVQRLTTFLCEGRHAACCLLRSSARRWGCVAPTTQHMCAPVPALRSSLQSHPPSAAAALPHPCQPLAACVTSLSTLQTPPTLLAPNDLPQGAAVTGAPRGPAVP